MNNLTRQQFFGLNRTLIGLLIVVLFLPNILQSQIRFWQDGVPTFGKIANRQNVQIDSLIQLAQIKDFYQEGAEFRFILSGFDWQWPTELGQPTGEDIDFRTSQGTDLYIVTDGDGHRIIEINPVEPLVVWDFYSPNPASDYYLKYPVSTYPFEENQIKKYLITDKLKHRVIIVNRETKFIEWRYGDETPGDGPNQLNAPADAVRLPDRAQVLICDQGNNRVIIVDQTNGAIVWEWGRGIGGTLKVPVDVDYVPQTSEVLITEQNNHQVSLVSTLTNEITFQFGYGQADSLNRGLNNPTDADMLPNGHIMICDSSNQRLIEINRSGEIVWQFHRRLKGLKDADRLADNRILIISDKGEMRNLPSRLGYSSDTLYSEIHELDRNVNFDSLFLTFNIRPDTTIIRVQMRSADQDEDLSTMKWLGPTRENDFYVAAASKINPAHNGDIKYQIRAFLITTDPLYTPELTNARLTYHYFPEDSIGMVLTEPIRDSTGVIITSWDSLTFHTRLPMNPLKRNDVQIELRLLDADKKIELIDPINVSPFVATHAIRLNGNPTWRGRGVQAIQIKAKLLTSNSALSPIIKDWRVDWSTTESSASQIDFVNSEFEPVNYYHVSHDTSTLKFMNDFVRLRLFDSNLAQTTDLIQLVIQVRSGSPGERDSVVVELSRQATGEFVNRSGLKAIISNTFPDRSDKTIQCNDRDTLVVNYRDPADALDQSHARVVMIQNTRAKIRIENINAIPITEAAIGDSIHIRVVGENDQNYSPAQDTIWVELFDTESKDLKIIPLIEIADSLGRYNTGDFLSAYSVFLSVNPIGQTGLQTLPGSRVDARYQDNYLTVPVAVASIFIQTEPVVTPFSGLYDFVIAPNPYYANQHTELKFRAYTQIGDLHLKKIEIFNVAGEKVYDIEGETIFPQGVPDQQYGESNQWWNLLNENGNPVSSGTYFIKFSASISNGTNSTSQEIGVIRKILIVR